MRTNTHIHIIPAHLGYKLVYGQDAELFVDDDVVAWRIETEEHQGRYITTTFPITPEGDPAENWLGYIRPDGKVNILEQTFDDWAAAVAGRKEFLESNG